MAKKLSKRKVKKLINSIVKMIELADLAEVEDAELDLSDYHRGSAAGLRAALSLISDEAVPEYAIIKRGDAFPYRFVPYEETGAAPELALDWCD
jgi:hypothetical protein